MHSFIILAGFLGAWLLVAGPVYQAAIELSEENDGHERTERDRNDLLARVTPPAPVSPWWWLLPPVGYILNRRRTQRIREAVIAQMDPDDVRHMIDFGRKATGWLLVATGGFAIALKETGELVEHFELSTAIFWLLVVVMALLCFGYTVVSLRRTERYLRRQNSSA